MQEVWDHLCTGFSCLHHVLYTTDDDIKGPFHGENLSRVRRRITRLSKLPWEEPTFNTHFLTKRNKLLHEKQNVGSAFSMARPGHPPSLANFSPCKHFNSPWLGEVNWPNARQSFRACVRALSALSFWQKVDLVCSPIKQPTFRDATGDLPAKWRLRNKRRNSILMTRHSPDLGGASDWLEVCFTDPTRSTTQIWVVTRHQYGFLRSFLRLHVAGKSLVASPNVDRSIDRSIDR